MRIIPKKTLEKIGLVIVIAFIFSAAVLSTQVFGAASGDGGGGSTATGPCYEGTGTSWRSCHGGTWIYYPLEGDSHYNAGMDLISIPGRGSVLGGSLRGCASEGATGYYRLALVSYNRSTGANVLSNGEFQQGLWPVNRWTNYGPGGYTNYRTDVPGSVNWSDAETAFRAAEAIGKTDGVAWDNVTLFCYNPEWGGCPEDDPYYPTCTPTPSYSSNYGSFVSKSTVIAKDGAIGSGNFSRTSDEDGYVIVKFSTDKQITEVDFRHTVYYKNTSGFTLNHPSGETDKIVTTVGTDPDPAIMTINTEWNVSGAYTKSSTSLFADPTTTGADSAISGTEGTATFNLAPGQTEIQCSTISYTNKFYNFTGTEHETQSYIAGGWVWQDSLGNIISDDDYNNLLLIDRVGYTRTYRSGRPKISHQDYIATPFGTGFSYACAEVTRVKEPGGGGDPEDPDPVVVGNNSSNITFAGETVLLKWNTTATGVATRRLSDSQVVSFLVSSNVNNSSYIAGKDRASMAPFDYYPAEDKKIYQNESWNTDDDGKLKYASDFTKDYNEAPFFKVPNKVGGKICASAGYKFEYWWGVDYGSGVDWNKDDGKDYWYIFRPSCRTIAKKPSAAVWNGGVFTVGGIKTTMSDRFNSIIFGEQTRDGDFATTKFGSWSEFLTVAGKSVKNSDNSFASGSILYKGSDPRNNLYPLTIANSDPSRDPGYSGIDANQTLKTRLESYLQKGASGIDDNKIKNEPKWHDITGTNIYSVSGALNIESDVITKNGSYTSIYDLPQVVIFVNGDVNISSNVQRIDAWIIATGTINTCSDFNNTTHSYYPGASDGNPCTNQLIFNGPVMANSIKLNRSFGSDPNVNTGLGVSVDSTTLNSSKWAPAEIFNLRADTYLWAYAQSTRYDSSFTESYSRELAPRY